MGPSPPTCQNTHCSTRYLPAVSVGRSFPDLLGQVLQDGAGFENRQARVGIHDRRHLVVRADGQELRLELVALVDVHRDDAVRQPGFLQHDGDLLAIARGPEIQVDQAFTPRAKVLGWRRRQYSAARQGEPDRECNDMPAPVKRCAATRQEAAGRTVRPSIFRDAEAHHGEPLLVQLFIPRHNCR